ncbi:hypothetical protein RS130_19380 [Paraglaciecola aquimarina]|uniref:Uncharacterized protein n=1 Tax=Paraglaciecola aquimarina TaxID=1235557 RepID=A0ABU3T0F6_9ALTE|nr:hypothetical protein [Paraglaciecola aquimarina]MDU0355754.1 hypothetical protein [Paraglaciecola aquimarina]
MGAKKGTNHFKVYQAKKVNQKLEALKMFLDEIPKRQTFSELGNLVSMCAHFIGCHRTTIKRNPAYMKLITAEFYSRNPNLKNVNPTYSFPSQISEAIKIRDAEIAVLSGQLNRINIDLKEAKAKIQYYLSADYRHELLKSEAVIESKPQVENTAIKDFEYTVHSLKLLLDYVDKKGFGIGIRNDGSNKIIADDGLGGISVEIVESKYLLPYLKYFKKLDK